MKFKSKTVLFFCAFALIFSVFSVSCFAYVSTIEQGHTYSFAPSITLEDSNGVPFDFDASGDLVVSIDGYICDQFIVSDSTIHIYGSDLSLYYSYSSGAGWTWIKAFADGSSTVVFSPEFTVVSVSEFVYYPFIDWLSGSVFSVSSNDSFYDSLYSSISDGVFGVGADLTSEQVMTLTLISTVLSYAFILLPLLLVIGFVLRCFRL